MASETVDPIDWSPPGTLMRSTPWAPRAQYKSVQLSHSRDSILQPCNLQHARQPPCLCGHSGYTLLRTDEIVVSSLVLFVVVCSYPSRLREIKAFLKVPVIISFRFGENNVLGTIFDIYINFRCRRGGWVGLHLTLFCLLFKKRKIHKCMTYTKIKFYIILILYSFSRIFFMKWV